MASKLTQITNGYHTFVENQVLTEKQLNEFVSYFDDQDRLSRVFLHGVGVVCGFEPSISAAKIILSQGVGITTDGDLIQLKEALGKTKDKQLAEASLSYSHYRKFKDENAFYAPFRKLQGKKELSSSTLEMYELFTENAEKTKALTELSGWKEMVVVLYLESYADEGDLCTAIDCDNQGIEQVNRLKVLLMPKSEAEFLAANDSVFSEFNVINRYFKLPAPAVKRVVLNQMYTSKYEQLKRAYSDAIAGGNTLADLKKGISELSGNFGEVLGLKLKKSELPVAMNRLDSLFSFKTFLEPFDIQYRYDFLKDLVDTYNEIVALLPDIRQMCTPNISAFPKHLMLGLMSETGDDFKHLRHGFYPAATAGCVAKEKAASLFNKLLEQIKNYSVQPGEIRITPSNKLNQLSQRSIPFYYSLNTFLFQSWDFEKTRIFRQNQQLSYHRENVADLPQLKDPLSYNADRFDFYRIEGHQGKDYRDVLEDLDDQKTRYGLSFDVKALSVNINTETLDVDDYECEFEDLKVMLKAWTSEQDCILAQVASFFSSFSTKVPGANAKEAELDLKSGARNTSILTNLSGNVASDKSTLLSKSSRTTSLLKLAFESNVVKENMSAVDDTLGVEMKKAIDETKGGSVNDLIASARTKILEKVNSDEWNAEPELKDFVANKSVELMAHTHILTQRMPLAVNLVDSVKIRDYKLSLSQLCLLVQKLKAGYQSTQLSVGLRAYTGLLINQLSTVCCSGKKLEVLLEEVNRRKEQILLRLQLSKFLEQHPGLEHKAGVEPGGTFVLVYKNKEVVADNSGLNSNILTGRQLSSEALASSKMILTNKIANLEILSTAERSSLSKSTTELINYGNYLDRLESIRTLEKFIPLSQVPDNTVIADFALPYMCCSDCAPINYIIAKPEASLRLERDKYCLLTDTDPIIFKVTPANGEVEASPETPGISIEEGKIVVHSDAFDLAMLGNPIRFTVNKQVTDAVLTVYQGVVADFKVPEEPTDQATLRFEATGKNLDGASFLWDFGDGSTSTETTPTHTYKLPVNDENKVTVSVLVTAPNGICKSRVEHDIAFSKIKPQITLKNPVYCENDKDSYLFEVLPVGAKVEISGPGVTRGSDGTYSFIPAAAQVGTIKFILNDEDSGISVQVVAAPQAACSPKQVENRLIISNLSKNASIFNWTVNGNKQTTNNLDPIVINLTANDPNEWKIALIAHGADVCPASRTSASIVTKFIDTIPVNNCQELASAAILSDSEILKKIVPTDLISKILEETRAIYGGSSDFSKGVIDRMNAFLNGDLNDQLAIMFSALFKNTVAVVFKLVNQPEQQKQAVILFELQLRLFYHILGCQSNDVIKKQGDIINSMLIQIIEHLKALKERGINFSDEMKKFSETYAGKVSDRVLLADHFKTINGNNLI